jgi:hypothetical protein
MRSIKLSRDEAIASLKAGGEVMCKEYSSDCSNEDCTGDVCECFTGIYLDDCLDDGTFDMPEDWKTGVINS